MPAIIQQAQLDQDEIDVLMSTLDGRVIEELLKGLRTALKNNRTQLDQAVRNGTLTAAQASRARTELQARLQILRDLAQHSDAAGPLCEAHEQAQQVLDQIHAALNP